jgi:hypothetical protein
MENGKFLSIMATLNGSTRPFITRPASLTYPREENF